MGNFMFNRLDTLLKSNHMTRRSLCIASGHADNYIRMFEKRNSEPPREFVNFCAEQLGTSNSYLYGETDDPSPAPTTATPEQKEKAPLSAAERLTEGLDEESLKKLLEYAEFLKSRQEKKENQ